MYFALFIESNKLKQTFYCFFSYFKAIFNLLKHSRQRYGIV